MPSEFFYDIYIDEERAGQVTGAPMPAVGERVWYGDWCRVVKRKWYTAKSRRDDDKIRMSGEVYLRTDEADGREVKP